MSNNKFFLDAMAHIDDSLIEDAVKDYKKPKKTFITTLSLVASFVLIIGISIPIILFGIIKTPGSIIDNTQSESTDGAGHVDTPNTTPSDENILSGSLIFQNKKNKNLAVIDHISDASIRFVLIRSDESIYDEYSLTKAIKDNTNSPFNITVDGKTVDDLPTQEGTYNVSIDFSSVSAKEKEAIIKYYFKANGYEQIVSQN